ncbi:Glutathione peroxidase BsaA [anaerobic digester metagenome]
MKASVIVLFSVMLFTVGAMAQSKSFYDFTVTDINGKEFPLSQLKGKKVMVVNTASQCGLTKQYKTLEEVYKTYGGDKFIIIGFPANNFLSQEPGTNDEIKEFCTKNYGVTFPMMSKISVKGDDMHPLYKWLTTKSINGVMDSEVGWNFQKYLIDENGNLVDMVKPRELPDSKRIIDFITGK